MRCCHVALRLLSAALASLSLCRSAQLPQLFDDLPAFAQSATVVGERDAFEAMCVTACGWGPALAAQLAHYRDLDRVFVMDWHGAGMNGIGNSLMHFMHPLSAGALADRASFSKRNAPECADSQGGCRMDPGAYVGTHRGAVWTWTEKFETSLRSRGVEEATLRFDNTSLGFVLQRAGQKALQIPGALDVLSLLLHEAVAPLPWVRFEWLHAPGEADAVNAVWKASATGGDPWGRGVATGKLLEDAMEASPAMQQRAQQCTDARRCLFASFLHPRPEFQETLLPYLMRMDVARASGGAVVAVQVRSGYADYAASAGEPVPEVHPQPRKFSALERQQIHADEWDKLNSVYPPKCLASPPPPPQPPPLPPQSPLLPSPPPNVSTCLKISPVVEAAVASRGASCAGANRTATFTLGVEEGEGGIYSTLLSCAANVALSASSGPDANWLLYVAGDLPPLFLLANFSVALKGHVSTAEGRLGHVSSNTVCHVEPGAAAKSCSHVSDDPGGAWTRTMIDWFLLGTINISTLHQGSSTFPGAVNLRRTWPGNVAAQGWDVHVTGPGESQVRVKLNTVVDQILHQLEAEVHAVGDTAQEECTRFLRCDAMETQQQGGVDAILAALHCAYVARWLDAVWISAEATTLLGNESTFGDEPKPDTLPVVQLDSLSAALRLDDASRHGDSGAAARVCGVTFAAGVVGCGKGTWCTGISNLPQLTPHGPSARSRCLGAAGGGKQADGIVGMAWYVGDGNIANTGHYANLYGLLNASLAVARNHTLTLVGGSNVAALTARSEFALAQVLPADASISQQLCALLVADVVIASAGVATLLAAFVGEPAGRKPFIVEVKHHPRDVRSSVDTAAEMPEVGPRNASGPVLTPDAVIQSSVPVGQNDFEFLMALDARLFGAVGLSSTSSPPTAYDVYTASAAAPLPSRVMLTPYNTTYALDAETYIHIGWYRSNSSELGNKRDTLAMLDPARVNLTDWNDRPGCALRSSTRIDVHDIDQVQLSRCNGTAPGGKVMPLNKLVTMCCTLLHGRYGNFNAYWLRIWMQHHAALGVGHFYLYVSNLTLPWFNGLSYDVLDVTSWEPGFFSHNHEGLGGAPNLQPWVQHDCLYRNKAQNNTWALFMDPDELLTLPGVDSLANLTRLMDEQGLDGASFGSVHYLPNPHPLTNLTRLRVPLPEGCLKWKFMGYWTCPDWHGRRKFIARINTTMELAIHDIAKIDRSRFACLNASRFWLMHYRGMPYEQLSHITSEFDGCTAIEDGGLTCGQLLFMGASNFTSEKPHLQLAMAQTALPLRPPPSPPSPPSTPKAPPLNPPPQLRRRGR